MRLICCSLNHSGILLHMACSFLLLLLLFLFLVFLVYLFNYKNQFIFYIIDTFFHSNVRLRFLSFFALVLFMFSFSFRSLLFLYFFLSSLFLSLSYLYNGILTREHRWGEQTCCASLAYLYG